MKLIAKAKIIERADGVYLVETHWTGHKLDRPCTGAISVSSSLALAYRLAKAIDAQKVHTDPKITKDVNGKTYVEADCQVMGRRLNSDLTRLGF